MWILLLYLFSFKHRYSRSRGIFPRLRIKFFKTHNGVFFTIFVI